MLLLPPVSTILGACRYIQVTTPPADPNFADLGVKATFEDCVATCNTTYCQFITYDYVTKKCYNRNGTLPVYVG